MLCSSTAHKGCLYPPELLVRTSTSHNHWRALGPGICPVSHCGTHLLVFVPKGDQGVGVRATEYAMACAL